METTLLCIFITDFNTYLQISMDGGDKWLLSKNKTTSAI